MLFQKEPLNRTLRDLAAWSGPLAGISLVGGVAATNALADAPYPRPGSSADDIKRYFSNNAQASRLNVAGQVISLAALGTFSVVVERLARRSSRLLQSTALLGGALSVATLTVSAASTLQLAQGEGEDPDTAAALHRRAFVSGGALHGPGLGLLVGTLGLAGRGTRSLPRWLSTACLASAAAGLLTPISLAVKPAAWLIPVSRFSALLLSGVAGVRLGRRSA